MDCGVLCVSNDPSADEEVAEMTKQPIRDPTKQTTDDSGSQQFVGELTTANQNVPEVSALDDGQRHPQESTARNGADANKRANLFIVVLILASLVGMAIATSGAIFGGKLGLFLPQAVFEVMAFCFVDICVKITNGSSGHQLVTAASNVLLQETLVKRAMCWLTIGLLQGAAFSLWQISFDTEKAEAAWQPETILYIITFTFIIRVGLTAGMMVAAHCDRRPNVAKWLFIAQSAYALAFVGECSPYPQIMALGRVAHLLSVTVGLYYLVVYKDSGAEQSEVQRGYTFLTGLSLPFVQYTTLYLTSLNLTSLNLNAFVISVVLMVWQKVCLKVCIPMTKLCFGVERKLWSSVVPAYMLAFELGPCLLLEQLHF